MSESTKRLAKDVYTISIHGVTGQPYEEGTLKSGALIKNTRSHGLFIRFEASTDNGETWFTQEAIHTPAMKPFRFSV